MCVLVMQGFTSQRRTVLKELVMRQANRKDGGYTTSKKAEWLTKLSHQGKWQDDTNGHNDN